MPILSLMIFPVYIYIYMHLHLDRILKNGSFLLLKIFFSVLLLITLCF